MPRLSIFTPDDIDTINQCTLQFHFWEQTAFAETEEDLFASVILATIQDLHAAGGSGRLNLPATLRKLEGHMSPALQADVAFATSARQIMATYHRRLRDEWPKVIASNETLRVQLKLARAMIVCEAMIDRIDREADGGVTAIKFITTPLHDLEKSADRDFEDSLEAYMALNEVEITLWHALTAAAYPNKRPVRIKYIWLYHNCERIVELTENRYRQTLEKIKKPLQAWLDGEILARPGLYCEACPFQYEGCPIYA